MTDSVRASGFDASDPNSGYVVEGTVLDFNCSNSDHTVVVGTQVGDTKLQWCHP